VYVTAYHLGALLFALIDRGFPGKDPVVAMLDAIRWPVSAMVVAAPVALILSRVINTEARLDPSKRMSEIRNKLTYLTGFISAAVVIGILAGLVYSLLGGELTIRFVLKSVTAAGIAGAVFVYYLREMRPAT
jgi:hypothetical protein